MERVMKVKSDSDELLVKVFIDGEKQYDAKIKADDSTCAFFTFGVKRWYNVKKIIWDKNLDNNIKSEYLRIKREINKNGSQDISLTFRDAMNNNITSNRVQQMIDIVKNK